MTMILIWGQINFKKVFLSNMGTDLSHLLDNAIQNV